MVGFIGIAMLSLLLSGCLGSTGRSASGSSTPLPAGRVPTPGRSIPLPRTARSAVVHADSLTLQQRSYTVTRHIVTHLNDAEALYVFSAVCQGSTDGHCQAVFAFRGSARHPFWHHQYAGILALRAVPSGFVVTAVNYAPEDPLCCPSLPAVSDSYTWNGTRFQEAGPLPNPPA